MSDQLRCINCWHRNDSHMKTGDRECCIVECKCPGYNKPETKPMERK